MTARTRYFVVTSLMVLAVGIGTGLVAYYVGLPTGAFSRQGGPDELQFVPRDAILVAYADVQGVMQSQVRQKLIAVLPNQDGQAEFERETGINIDTDIDRVVAALAPGLGGAPQAPPAGMVLARGRFDAVKIQNLMTDHGARAEDYKGVRLLVGAHPEAGDLSVGFVEPGLAVIGSAHLVRSAVDLKAGGANVTDNDELMALVRASDAGNAWAVGRFDALGARVPEEVASRLPAITWFSATGHINGGIRATVRVDTRDEEAADNLREVMRGFVALAKMQLGSRTDLQALTRSLELGGTGNTIALSFEVPIELFDALAAAADGGLRPQPAPRRELQAQ